MKKSKIKNIFVFLLLFFFLLFVALVTTDFGSDEVWNYGFSKNIYEGLIPYKDFNMIIPPFFPFMMSLPFHLFGTNELVFQISNILLLLFTFYLLKRMIGKLCSLVLLFLVFPLSLVLPTYNLFLFVLLILVIYLEEEEYSDIIIGLVLGICILTKHTVGGFIFLVGILSQIKNKESFFFRMLFSMIPVGVFAIYLVTHHIFYEFIDQCFLGMLNFGHNNAVFFIFPSLIMVGCLIEIIYFIKSCPDKVIYYYIFAFYSIVIPMINVYHVQLALLGCCFITIYHYMDFFKKYEKYFVLFSIAILVLSQILIVLSYSKPIIYPNDIHNFEYRYLDNNTIDLTHQMSDFIDQYPNKNIIFLTKESYYIHISNNKPIDRFSLINYGNNGYRGSEKIIDLIKKNKDSYFVTYKNMDEVSGQTDRKVIQYVLEHGKKIDDAVVYSVYSFE